MLGLSRVSRLSLSVILGIIICSLYFLYPSSSRPDERDWQAGGIDSEHWRDPISPQLDDYGSHDGAGSNRLHHFESSSPGGMEHEELRWDVKGSGSRISGAFDPASHKPIGAQGSGGMEALLGGGTIMPKMENATAKADLGRAAWKVMHLMTLRYPDNPSEDDRQALKSYFQLFSRLYPCGECATEFQKLLKEYPPQTSSRKVASLWLCHIHNLVNERLGKPEFDCLTLDATYDCGCGDDPLDGTSTSSSSSSTASTDTTLLPETLLSTSLGPSLQVDRAEVDKADDDTEDEKGDEPTEEGQEGTQSYGHDFGVSPGDGYPHSRPDGEPVDEIATGVSKTPDAPS